MSEARVDSHLFIIFGGTGDLTARKLIPALLQLRKAGYLDQRSVVLAVARKSTFDDSTYRAWTREALLAEGLAEEAVSSWCEECLHYQPLGEGGSEDYQALAKRILGIEREHRLAGNRAFYLALPHAAFAGIVAGLKQAGLNRGPGWTRLVIEKPFGHDLSSACQLNQQLHQVFEERHIYRIDHYLGKETVQNLLVFRFANAIFESLWNREHIERVEITVAEQLGVEDRAGYYDRSGALRDMVQNHIAQLLTLVAMEVPAVYDAESVRFEKIKVLRSLSPIAAEQVVYGQYALGEIEGRQVRGYQEEAGVAPGSTTETFVALRLGVNNWRWQGVPFCIRTGKRLARRLTQIVVTFRRPPVCLFQSFGACLVGSNELVITLQPDEGFALRFDVKAPGEPLRLERCPLRFNYREAFGAPPDAYETLLLDFLMGDQTLFVHADEVETSWRAFSPLLEQEIKVEPYPAGSWGPEAANRLAAVPRV